MMIAKGNHWVSLVILPEHYSGTPNYLKIDQSQMSTIGIEVEQVYLYDSIASTRNIPIKLKTTLCTGEYAKRGKGMIRVPGLFGQECRYTEHTGLDQQAGTNTCGYWAMYNVLMTVLTGSDAF